MRILVLLFLLCLLACRKNNNAPHAYPNGRYTGTFQRMHAENSPISNVAIAFDFPYWTGTSSIQKYPAINKGTFRYINDALEFKNTSPWTADFDWTLILDGYYIDRRGADSLIFTKSYGNGWVDVYKLKKVD